MGKSFITKKFEGTINGTETKKFLVALAKTRRCDSVYLDLVDDGWMDDNPTDIFNDDPTNGIKVKVYFVMEEREYGKRPLLEDNPSVAKFIEQFPTIYFAG